MRWKIKQILSLKKQKEAYKIRKNKNEKKGRDEKCDLPGSQ